MKGTILILMLVLFSAAVGYGQDIQSNGQPVIRGTELIEISGVIGKQVPLEQLLADSYVRVGLHGETVTRAEEISRYQQNSSLGFLGDLFWFGYFSDNPRSFAIADNTAMASFLVMGRAKNNLPEIPYRMVLVFTRNNGTWKILSIQTIRVEAH